MTDISHFFTPVDFETLIDTELNPLQLGQVITIYKQNTDFPEIENQHMAIIGVNESRNSVNNEGCERAANATRKYLYKLYSGEFNAKIVDLGDINPGHSTEDTYFALRTTIDALIRKNVIPIIIGGSQDLSYPQFWGIRILSKRSIL